MIKQKLNQAGLRLTSQRLRIAEILFSGPPKHFTAEHVYEIIQKQNLNISLATIYNTLKQFTNLGLIREIVVDKNKSLYDTNNRPHYHLYIEDEGKIHDIPTDNINIDFPDNI